MKFLDEKIYSLCASFFLPSVYIADIISLTIYDGVEIMSVRPRAREAAQSSQRPGEVSGEAAWGGEDQAQAWGTGLTEINLPVLVSLADQDDSCRGQQKTQSE